MVLKKYSEVQWSICSKDIFQTLLVYLIVKNIQRLLDNLRYPRILGWCLEYHTSRCENPNIWNVTQDISRLLKNIPVDPRISRCKNSKQLERHT